ncbi:23S rRNA (adenine(2503)-C(2))-methyltransferase RlmN [Desulfospira joergensenii]|uniref:23S rRNA (adenine(2503)-C(2))-methyltransferase RlmN n=1 Tax=Desulfospira joergensenii TaxID=53329 RepID=UPI0003B594F8|nr:23S rRNA (adenine(2503)-C(2))-methyltransferase RlmN [Desulfospira joergensenii]
MAENILDYTRDELAQWLENRGVRPFRAGQIFKWIYLRQARDFDEMTDLGKELRGTLKENFVLSRLVLEEKQVSKDTTEKYLFRLEDGTHIESVLIPEKDHFTLCVSSQVGCAMDCQFCLTARGGFVRNLTVSEIISQVRDARFFLIERGIEPLSLSNIVFMGMGEPLANYENLIRSLGIITDTDFGMKFSPRRVTVSTSGLVPRISDLGNQTDVNLAVSLNAVDDKTRTRLMPINKKYPLKDLLRACKDFKMKPRNKITFEYILIRGVNDSDKDAQTLVRLLSPLRAKVNLIPFNQHPGCDFKRPDKERVSSFLQILLDRDMTAIVRKSKGDDILAACGQLKAKMFG